ncbi:MAG: hypothetical protein ACLRZG_10195 [Streptococcus sp.]
MTISSILAKRHSQKRPEIVEREGAAEIYAVSSHGLFVKGAVELLDQAPIKEILVTDSVAPNGPTPKNINYLTASRTDR